MRIRHPKQQVSKQSRLNIQLSSWKKGGGTLKPKYCINEHICSVIVIGDFLFNLSNMWIKNLLGLFSSWK